MLWGSLCKMHGKPSITWDFLKVRRDRWRWTPAVRAARLVAQENEPRRGGAHVLEQHHVRISSIEDARFFQSISGDSATFEFQKISKVSLKYCNLTVTLIKLFVFAWILSDTIILEKIIPNNVTIILFLDIYRFQFDFHHDYRNNTESYLIFD